MDHAVSRFMDLGQAMDAYEGTCRRRSESRSVKSILHLLCSPRGRAAESSRLSQRIVDALLMKEAGAQVVTRLLADQPLGHVDADYAVSQHSLADVSQEGTAAISALLIEELKSADFIVIGTPIHNFTIPSALKAWIDHVVRVRWTFDVSPNGKIGRLHDRPVLIAFSSGGRFTGERARQPDFMTPYLLAVFGIIGLRDLSFFSVQGAAFGPEAVQEARRTADAMVLAHVLNISPSGQPLDGDTTWQLPATTTTFPTASSRRR
jgi:FMN-dependent NADH-azoreductase